MHWNIQKRFSSVEPKKRIEEIIDSILDNRGLIQKSSREEFLAPKDPLTLSLKAVGIDALMMKTAVERIKRAIDEKQPIIIYGDYDADGVTATAILWETIHGIQGKAYPFIPSREFHGYGLSIKGLDAALALYEVACKQSRPLIITVDNGIVAMDAAQYLQQLGLELIITDHHQKGEHSPLSLCTVHTTQLSGAGVAWMMAKELNQEFAESTLDLATIGTVADLLPLLEANRSIVKFGLSRITESIRPGLKALMIESGIDRGTEISTYHISFLLAPRINAMGRLTHAIDSLRLLCTRSDERAHELAAVLSETNRNRQDLTTEYIEKARQMVGMSYEGEHILVLDDPAFHEGVIGLVAGKMVETYSRPSIVIQRGETISKASARSVNGVNVIELIRTFEKHLLNAGGHPMAAGFTIETEKIEVFKEKIQTYARETIAKELLVPRLKVDCEILVEDIQDALWERLNDLKPFGMGNSQPVFSIEKVHVLDARMIGRDMKHLKLKLRQNGSATVTALAFNQADKYEDIVVSGLCSVAFTIDENIWNGHRELQLKIKDIVN